jgi:tetraacyldisaccharide 4'-kinase
VHLLDDGFQHRQLHRTVDLVVVTAEDLDDVLLPAGNLRERWKALRRADAVVVREDERNAVEARVRERMKPGAWLWSVRREQQLPDPEWAGKRAVAFCAIARPAGFLSMLAGAGCPVVKAVVFSDHHPYRMEDVRHIVKVAQEAKATGFLITEKDYVKLSELMIGQLQSVGPVRVVPLKAKFVGEEDVVRELEARIR